MPTYLYNSKKTSSGFTLIELLVVILVIGTLSGVLLGVVNSEGVRAKARDSQRKADLNKIRLALETYFADNRQYPAQNTWAQIAPGTTIVTELSNGYINPVPLDPSRESGTNNDPCSNLEFNRYLYRTNAGGYNLVSIMEVSSSNDDSPCSGFVCLCPVDDCILDYCYMVRNP